MPVGPAIVLELWEQALPLDDAGRAVVLAASVAPPVSADDVLAWPLGRRDARLLQLHAALSGRVMDGVTACPRCDAEISFETDASQLERAGEVTEPAPVEVDGWRVSCRPLTTDDLTAAADAEGTPAAEEVLLAKAMVSVNPPRGTDAQPLPLPVRRAVANSLAAADPLAEVLVELECPDCRAPMTASVDVAAFAWAAVDTKARRLLQDVDVLARAYGWTEDEVLALGDQRRATYLRLARGGVS